MADSAQQLFPLSQYIDEKDQASTQADYVIDSSNLPIITPILNKLSLIPAILLQQHSIVAGLTTNNFNADKIFKATSSVLKVLKSYNLTSKISKLDKVNVQLGQIRRLIRIDRLIVLCKQFYGIFNKKEITKTDKCMMIFKAMILVQDLNDLFAFLVQLKVFKKDHLLPNLFKTTFNLYFLECIGWLLYHLKQYCNAKNSEEKEKNKMALMKYILDRLVAHNQFHFKLFTLNPKLTSLLSISSAFINLYLVWK